MNQKVYENDEVVVCIHGDLVKITVLGRGHVCLTLEGLADIAEAVAQYVESAAEYVGLVEAL